MTRTLGSGPSDLQVFRIGGDDDPDLRSAPAAHHKVPPASPPFLRGRRFFEGLVAPRAPEQFLARIWGQRPLRLRPPAGRRWTTSVLDSESIERLLERHELPPTAVRVVSSNGASRVLTRSGEATYDLFTGGRALVFHDLHIHAPAVGEACVGLSNELGIPVRASAHFLPPGVTLAPSSAPFARFIVQLEGGGRTTVHHNGKERSFRRAPGDVLYLPRKISHRLQSGAERSLSLVLDIHELSAFDLMKRLGDDALIRCSEDLSFRRSCSTAGDRWTGEDRAYLDECLRRFGAAFRLEHLEDVREDLYLSDASEIAASAARFSYGQLLATLRPSTRLERRPVLFFARRTDQHLVLKLAGRKLLFPLRIADAFDFVTTQERFRLGSIPQLDAPGRLVLARRLVREGFLLVAQR